MAILANPNEEAFVQKWHETGNKSEAYRYAFPKSQKWKDESVHPKASELSKVDKVLARFNELQKATADNHGITIQSLLEELNDNRKAALENVQIGAANAATMGKAKLCGLDVQRVETKIAVSDDSGLDW